MSVKVMGIIWDHFPLGGGERLTALCLADHADHEGGNIYPSVARIAAKTLQSERTVQRHLQGMRAIGWLVETEAGGHGPGSTATYRIPIEALIGPSGGPVEATPGTVTEWHPSGQPVQNPGNSVDKLSTRVTNRRKRVTPDAKKGDTAMSPELGLSVLYNKRAEPIGHSAQKTGTDTPGGHGFTTSGALGQP